MTHSRLLFRLMVLISLAASVSPSLAETFYLTDGRTIEGTVVRKVGNVLSIKPNTPGIERLRLDQIERVEFITPAGDRLSAKITGWSNGTYQLSTEGGPLEAKVEGGRLVAAVSREAAEPDPEEGGAEAQQAATSDEADSAPASAAPTPSGPLTAGFVYVGVADDGGRNFMLDGGRRRLAQDPRIGETLTAEVDGDDDGQTIDAVERLVADGAELIFMTGARPSSTVAEAARQHENVQFVHCGPFDGVRNVDVFCGRIYQARYLSGIIAGGVTATDLIGYIAAEPTSDVIVGINAFALGVQSVNPDAQVMVHWTNSWYAPSRERSHASDLIDRGVDVLTIHQDSPAALQIAEEEGVSTIGFQSDMSAFAPSSILTSVMWDWGEMYGQIVDQIGSGAPQLRPAWLGLREGVVGLAPISERVPDDLRRLVQQRQREMTEGRFNVFTGPIRDVDGDVRVPAGRIMTDDSLQTMDYLVQGVVGY